MPKFRYRILARKIGAIGDQQIYEGEIEGNDVNDAHLKLYESYEHIHSWKFTEITNGAGNAKA